MIGRLIGMGEAPEMTSKSAFEGTSRSDVGREPPGS
jgi:hypothetical protein